MCSGCIEQAAPEKLARREAERAEREAAVLAAELALPYEEQGISPPPPPVSGGATKPGWGPGAAIDGTAYENARERLGGRYSVEGGLTEEDAELAAPDEGDPDAAATPLYRCPPDGKPKGYVERRLEIVDDEDGLGRTVVFPNGRLRKYRYALDGSGNIAATREVAADATAKG